MIGEKQASDWSFLAFTSWNVFDLQLYCADHLLIIEEPLVCFHKTNQEALKTFMKKEESL